MKDSLVKGVAVTNRGFEAVCAGELEGFGCSGISVRDGVVLFYAKTLEGLCSIAYSARSVTDVLLFVAEVPRGDESGIECVLEASKIGEFISSTNSFAVKCMRMARPGPDNQEFSGILGGVIRKVSCGRVDLNAPDVGCVGVGCGESCIVGIDFAGFDLGKRDYRVFIGAESLKGNVAFGILMLSDFSAKTVLLDPFCRSGIIPIEAALFVSNMSPHFFSKHSFAFLKLPFLKNIAFEKLFERIDAQKKKVSCKSRCFDLSFGHVQAARKNAKIAGVIDFLEFSRTDVEWLDVKFEHESIDRIVSFPPQLSKSVNKKSVEKVYNSFFRRSSDVLAKVGLITLVAHQNSEAVIMACASANKFFLKKRQVFYQGAEELFALVFGK